MPTVTFRLSRDEADDLARRAAIAGVTMSELVREALFDRDPPDTSARLDDHEQRLARLDRLAGDAY